MEKLLFITTSSLSSNPRLLKEVLLFKELYECHVMCFHHKDWTDKLDEDFIDENRDISFHRISRSQNWFQTILSKGLNKLSSLFIALSFYPLFFKSVKYNDKTFNILVELRKLKRISFKRVFLHNPGTFYPGTLFANRVNASLQIDVEDYHPGENYGQSSDEIVHLMDYAFENVHTVTFASKGIYHKCKRTFNFPECVKLCTVINCFNSSDFIGNSKSFNESKINVVWFSQYICPDRGVEMIFEIAPKFSDIIFHLIGTKRQDFLDQFELSDNIKLHAAMSQKELHAFLRSMDVGLALESKALDENKDICLANKIVAYAQAGLYILATDTFGQRDFLENLSYNAGKVITSDLEYELKKLDENILNEKEDRSSKALIFSWEEESKKLLSLFK